MEQKYSDEGECTNRVWTTFISDMRRKNCGIVNGIYPTIRARCKITYQMYFSGDEYWKDKDGNPLKGEKLYDRKCARYFGWIPLTVIWITSPLDAVIDTLYVPWDLYELNSIKESRDEAR